MKLLVAFVISFVSALGWAAKPPLSFEARTEKSLPQKMDIQRTLEALNLPTPNALKVLSAQGSGGYKNLVKLAFAADQSIDTQWKALVLMSILGGELSLPQLERAATSDQWYRRNAALIGFSKVSREKSLQWARKMLTDPSLIVRTSAVETLRLFHDVESVNLLWTELYHERNFKSGQSLWVRRHIVEALSEFAKQGDEAKLIGVLKDADDSLYRPAVQGLERLTRVSLGQPDEPVAFKKKYWQNWWQARHNESSQTL
jgi:HEAT repeat protein